MNLFGNKSKIVVIGTSGSGKSHLAKRLSDRFGLKDIELDALYWEQNWVPAEIVVFQTRVEQAIQADGWVVHGNYNKVRDATWLKADTIVWLDYSFPLVMFRTLKRTIVRSITKKPMWNGNRETLRKAFLTKDSILLWVLQTYWRRRREYPELFKDPKYAHLKIIHLKTPSEADALLK